MLRFELLGTDASSHARRGRLTLARHREYGTFKTVVLPGEAISADAKALGPGWEDALATVWEDGELVREWSFAQVRARSAG